MIFVRVGIERNPAKSLKSTKMDGFGPLWNRTSIRIAPKRVREESAKIIEIDENGWFWIPFGAEPQ